MSRSLSNLLTRTQVLLSGDVPFYQIRSEVAVVRALTSDGGQYPKKPTRDEMRDKDVSWLWNLCLQCWARKPSERPGMTQVLKKLSNKPDCKDVSDLLDQLRHECFGGSADIYSGKMRIESDPSMSDGYQWKSVAVKKFRIDSREKLNIQTVWPSVHSQVLKIWLNGIAYRLLKEKCEFGQH